MRKKLITLDVSRIHENYIDIPKTGELCSNKDGNANIFFCKMTAKCMFHQILEYYKLKRIFHPVKQHYLAMLQSSYYYSLLIFCCKKSRNSLIDHIFTQSFRERIFIVKA